MEGQAETPADEVLTETGQRMLRKSQMQYTTLEMSFYGGIALGVLSALALVGTWWLKHGGGH